VTSPAPCNGSCECPEPCPECPSIPPFARLAFSWPPPDPAHALPQSESVQPGPRREASEAGSTHHHNEASKRAEGGK
jgi:hypothetical protein